MVIPENRAFHQIFLSLDAREELPLPLRQVSAQARDLFADFQYCLWRDEAIRQFLAAHYGQDVLQAYDLLKPLAFKADLARYCILHRFGGWYADLSLKILEFVPLDQSIEMVYFHDFGLGPPAPSSFLAACQNGFFFAKAGHPVLEQCIKVVLDHCRQRFYGLNSTCPTGPMVFGKAILAHAPSPNLMPGYFMPLTPMHSQRNLAYVMPRGNIVAFHKTTWHPSSPRGGNFSAFGLQGTNNYNRLWESREVYG